MLILCQSNLGVYTGILVRPATSGCDGTDSALEYMLSGAHGLLWLCPIVLGTYGHRFPRPRVGNAYPLPKAPECV
jgi:hypothetical protein